MGRATAPPKLHGARNFGSPAARAGSLGRAILLRLGVDFPLTGETYLQASSYSRMSLGDPGSSSSGCFVVRSK